MISEFLEKKILDYLVGGYVKKLGEKLKDSDVVITEGKGMYLDGVIERAVKKNIDLESMDHLYLIGGTSQLLEENIEAHENLSKICTVIEEAETVSVIGNLFYGAKKING